jgi:hypothetical protein
MFFSTFKVSLKFKSGGSFLSAFDGNEPHYSWPLLMAEPHSAPLD